MQILYNTPTSGLTQRDCETANLKVTTLWVSTRLLKWNYVATDWKFLLPGILLGLFIGFSYIYATDDDQENMPFKVLQLLPCYKTS